MIGTYWQAKAKSAYNTNMLRLSNNYINRSILSLRTGGVIGIAVNPIINPNNLKIEGWYAENKLEKGDFVLPSREIRDFITKGLVVNDHDSITHPDDLVRMKDTIDLKFELIGKTVVTENKKKLGKVADYSVEESSYYIQKLYVNPSILKGLTNDQLVIDRNQIVEITDKKIIVQSAEEKLGSKVPIRAKA
jgi:sporulation protein YlmC with PRC-barrel domain